MLGALSTLALTSVGVAQAASSSKPLITYDYVIVGAGTSGLVLANRLSEIQNVTVAVIEAGDSVLNNVNVTNIGGYGLAFGTGIDWAYQTTNQTKAGGLKQTMRAGKAIGGTSAINGMAYTRAEDVQIDAWEAIGNEGWTWKSLLPYFKKSQTLELPTKAQANAGVTFDPQENGFQGPLTTGWTSSLMIKSFHTILNETYANLGVPWNEDVNGGKMRGYNRFASTIDPAANVREDAGRAYYYPIANRTNLHLYPSTFAHRIVWTSGSSAPTANGVEVQASNSSTPYIIGARAEVIVSAGALASPVILELSGIGNPAILKKHNISVVVDLPTVGENLQDQTNTGLISKAAGNNSFSGSPDFVAYPTAADIFGSRIANISASVLASLPDYAAKVSAASGNVTKAADLLKLFKLQHDLIFSTTHPVPMAEILIEPFGTVIDVEYWALLPFSRGSVHITSSVPGVAAAINPNYYMLDWDITGQIGTAQYIRKIFATAPFSSLVGKETKPGFDVVPANATAAQWFEWNKSIYRSNFHPVATAAMMPRDIGGVVDTNLKVYGTSNVRVVDASVLPFQVCGHLTSTLYAVAERAADLIKSGM
ncbi:Glucose oxidase [Lachnellula suecica]|uniref:Glucose oxidase n=1 Tax=Lachnellula suecica TaxID=602035 RepID=A0A8T9C7E6_9HELO|nr:Glucose oxidase [Lachnellula suecica]